MRVSFVNVLASLVLIFGLGMLHSPSDVQSTVASSAEVSCQVTKKDCCEGGGWKCCGANGCKIDKDGCTSFPSTGNGSGEDME
ncbi:MAG: hypothetical protein OXF48_01650 [Bacteroidetes bacterium]|nr:hypothetical protein [Bacteroidota bacterium]